jgi:hypothetical protein
MLARTHSEWWIAKIPREVWWDGGYTGSGLHPSPVLWWLWYCLGTVLQLLHMQSRKGAWPLIAQGQGLTEETCFLLVRAQSATLTSSIGSCAVVLLSWCTTFSVQYSGPYNESDAVVVAFGGSNTVDIHHTPRSCVVLPHLPSWTLHHPPTCVSIHMMWCIMPSFLIRELM